MSERLKMFLRIIAFLAVTGLFAYGLYALFFARDTVVVDDNVTTDGGTTGSGLPTSGNSNPISTNDDEETTDSQSDDKLPPSKVANGGETFTTLLTNSRINSPTVTADGSIAYYDPTDGRFYTINEDGDVVALSQQQFPQAENVVFSSGATTAVIEFPDGSNVVYDFETAKQVTLPSHWEEFSFSEDGESIVSKSLGTNESSRTLVMTASDGSTTQVIASLGANADSVDVNMSPGNNVVGFSRTGGVQNAFGRQEIYLIGVDGEDAGALIVDGSSFSGIWAPDGRHLMYSVADASDGYRAALWFVDTKGQSTRKKLGIKTAVDKCTITSDSLAYCAVPRDMPAGGGTDSNLIHAYDDLYEVSLSSGRATLSAIPAADTRMFNLNVSPSGDLLYYTDSSGRLNYIRLE